MKRLPNLFSSLLVLAPSLAACSAAPSSPDSQIVVPPATTPGVQEPGVPVPSGPNTSPVAPTVAPTSPIPGVSPTAPINPTTPVPSDTNVPAPTTSPSSTTETTDTSDTPAPVAQVVNFSTPSGTFQGQISVGIAAEEGLTIRYTTDGSLPGAASTPYDGNPLVLTETTQVRAQAFDGEQPKGNVVTGIYIARTFDKPSDVPIIIIEGYGGGRPQKTVSFGGGFGGGQPAEPPAPQPYYDAAFMVFEPVNGEASIANPPTFVTRAGYRERGQSSANAEKSPYKVEFWDEDDNDIDLPVLGMPPESDWAMIGEYFDKSQIQNAFIYGLGADLGLATVRLRFAELYINFDGGPLEESDYFGLYALTETIKNQKNRLNLKQLRPEVTTEPEISGGYIFKFDQAALDSGEAEIICTGSEPLARGAYNPSAHCFNDLGFVDPDVPNEAQLNYLTTFVQGFHDALHQTPIGNYSQFIDVGSFIDFMIVTELSGHVDAYVRSSYFFKERNEPINAGPLWDFNLGMASTNAATDGWRFETQLTSRGNDDWFYQLGQDPAFMQQFAQRWRELRSGILSDAQLIERIETIAAPLANAGQRDFERWPNSGLGGGFGGFGGMGGNGGGQTNQPTTWRGHVDKLIEWVPTRTAWIDSALAEVP